MPRHPLVRSILTDLHAEIERTTAPEGALRPLQQARRERIDALIDQSIDGVDVPCSVGRKLGAGRIEAKLYWRLAIQGERLYRDHIARLARTVAAAPRVGAQS